MVLHIDESIIGFLSWFGMRTNGSSRGCSRIQWSGRTSRGPFRILTWSFITFPTFLVTFQPSILRHFFSFGSLWLCQRSLAFGFRTSWLLILNLSYSFPLDFHLILSNSPLSFNRLLRPFCHLHRCKMFIEFRFMTKKLKEDSQQLCSNKCACF